MTIKTMQREDTLCGFFNKKIECIRLNKQNMNKQNNREKFDNPIFPKDNFENVLKGYQMLRDNMPFLINLSPEERYKHSEIDVKRIPFVRKSLEYARKDPDPLPRNIDLHKLGVDLDVVLKLKRIKREHQKLSEALADTLAVFGNNSYQLSLIIYKSYGQARSTDYPGIDSIYNDLSKHHKRGRYKKKQNTEEDQP